MPTGRFKYGFLAKYPHLNTADKAVWERFIASYPTAYETVDYDFALDEQSGAEQVAGDFLIPGAERVYNFRIDVIAYRASEIHIIELKDKADAAAIGQLGHYRDIYLSDEKPTEPVNAVIIAGSVVPRLEDFLSKNHVSLIIV